MIASCPQCNSRYRIAREKIGEAGARIRCSRCDTIFRVEAPGPRPEDALTPDAENLTQPVAAAAPPATPQVEAPAAQAAPPAAPQVEMPASQPFETSAPQAPASPQPEVVSEDLVAAAATPLQTPASPEPAAAPQPVEVSQPVEMPQPVEVPQPVAVPQPTGPRPNVLVAESDSEIAKSISELLDTWGLDAHVVTDGSEALLQSFRNEFALTIFGGHLPGVSAPVLTEVLRRSTERRDAKIIRIAPMDEPAGTPEFEATHMLEPGDLPGGLVGFFEQMGVGTRPQAPLTEAQSPVGGAPTPLAEAPTPDLAPPAVAPAAPESPVAAPPQPVAQEAVAPAEAAPAAKPRRRRAPPLSDDPEIAAAERLARIAVSDVILYNEEKFASAVAAGGDIVASMASEIEEARAHFNQRIPEAVRSQKDFLAEELRRRASA